jgi:hypothetical protein
MASHEIDEQQHPTTHVRGQEKKEALVMIEFGLSAMRFSMILP